MVSNAALEDTRLSWRARGVLAYLLSRPEGWSTSGERLASQSPGGTEGRDAMRAALKELESFGYLQRERVQGSRGRWATALVITDTPAVGGDTTTVVSANDLAAETAKRVPEQPPVTAAKNVGSPGVGRPGVGGPVVGQPGVISKKESKTDNKKEDLSPPSTSSSGGGMPRQSLAWYPKPETIAVAKEAYPWATDVAMKMVTMTLIAWCQTKKRKPDDALWLTFMKREDADRAKAEREEQAPATTRKWFDVAD